jgi:hypothetical protein
MVVPANAGPITTGANFAKATNSIALSTDRGVWAPAFAGTTREKILQILPAASFCIRLAISISCRQARSTNDITRSMS